MKVPELPKESAFAQCWGGCDSPSQGSSEVGGGAVEVSRTGVGRCFSFLDLKSVFTA